MQEPETQLLNSIVARTHVGIFVVNRDYEVLLWNQFMASNSGRNAESMIGKNLFDEFPELPRQWLERKIKNVCILKNFSFSSWEQRPYLFKFAHNRPVTGGIDYMRQDITLMPVKNQSGEVEQICFTLIDTTDTCIYQSQILGLKEKAERASNYDGLTDIYNRSFVENILNKEFARAIRFEHTMTVILADIDHFKAVNDNHGHLAGDEVLREVAARLGSQLRASDTLGRYGGEEFIFVLPETDRNGAVILAERLRKKIEAEPVQCQGKDLFVTISLGVSELSQSCEIYEHLINESDTALYQSKGSGRNKVTVFSATTDRPSAVADS